MSGGGFVICSQQTVKAEGNNTEAWTRMAIDKTIKDLDARDIGFIAMLLYELHLDLLELL